MRTKGVRRVDQDQARKIIGTWGSGGMIHRKEKREREGRKRREKDRRQKGRTKETGNWGRTWRSGEKCHR
jgi:hypothetical protein